MADATVLARDDALVAEAIAAFPADAVVAALADAEDEAVQAGLAIVAGLQGVGDAIPALVELIDDDTLAARAAAWALGRLPSEEAVRAAVSGGSLDQREHGYQALAGLATAGNAAADLAEFAQAQLAFELSRAAEGFTGLGEQVCRLLAVIGAEGVVDAIQQVIEQDPHTDRFELQRLRKQVDEYGRDQETIAELAGDWQALFEDELAAPLADEPEPAPETAAPAATPETIADAPVPEGAVDARYPDESLDETVPMPPAGQGPEGAEGEGDEEAQPEPTPVDWETFASHPLFALLDDKTQQLAKQLGPMLEQIVGRMTGLGLPDLQGQELAALLLQVLPQALPPQTVNVALSPEGINAFQCLAKFLVAEYAADSALIDAVKMVREQMRESIRASGMLGGPDYSDPDEAAADD